MNNPALKRFIQPKNILSGLSAGVVIGIINTTINISLAALIFSGPLAIFLPNGIGMMVVSAIIFLFLIGITSSFRGIIAGPQDSPAAILGLTATAVARGMPAGSSPDSIFATIIATISITSILTGLFFLALGQFKLGNLVRFIPYPVVGGFLAGTGWLLVTGAFSVMVGFPFSLHALSGYFSINIMRQWLPGLVLGITLAWATRRFKSVAITPGTMLAALLAFYCWLAITHTTINTAGIEGLLLGPFPQGALWRPLMPDTLARVDWRLVLRQGGQVGMVLVVSVIALLLNAGGIELATRQDMDLNRELRSAGFANLVAGVFGGAVGYHYLSDSVLAHKMGARNWTTIILAILMSLTVLFLGSSILAYVPKLLVGGLLLFLGFSFLVEWVYDAFFKLPHVDYFLVLVILGIIGAFGFLQGVGVGLGIALLLFVVKYSRINVVKHILTGTSYHSAVDRPYVQRQLLREKGPRLFILQLQGFIFFGTAQVLLDLIRDRLAEQNQPKPDFLILDFRRVSGFDSSAVSIFMRMKQLAEATNVQLVFTQLSKDMTNQLEQGGLNQSANGIFHIFASLDFGVEWCEDRILHEEAGVYGDLDGLIKQFSRVFPSNSMLERFLGYLEKMEVPAGFKLVRQGDAADVMFFIETGSVTAQLELNDGRTIRLRKMLCGTVVGEIGIYLENVRTASVVTAESSTLYRLSKTAICQMEQTDPIIAAALHHWIAQLLADRLAESNNSLVAVLD